MQQTETYKLNLIESSDPFLPDALNENTRKIEEVVQEKLAEMDARVTVTELHQAAAGTFSYKNDTAQTIELGFTPKAVYVRMTSTGNSRDYLIVDGVKPDTELSIVEGGFQLTPKTNTYLYGSFAYVAIA